MVMVDRNVLKIKPKIFSTATLYENEKGEKKKGIIRYLDFVPLFSNVCVCMYVLKFKLQVFLLPLPLIRFSLAFSSASSYIYIFFTTLAFINTNVLTTSPFLHVLYCTLHYIIYYLYMYKKLLYFRGSFYFPFVSFSPFFFPLLYIIFFFLSCSYSLFDIFFSLNEITFSYNIMYNIYLYLCRYTYFLQCLC